MIPPRRSVSFGDDAFASLVDDAPTSPDHLA